MAVAFLSLVACAEPRHVESAPARIVEQLSSSADTPATGVVLEPVPTSIVDDSPTTQLEVVHGTFLGVGPGSSLADALRAFGVSPTLEDSGQPSTLALTTGETGPCLPLSHTRWVIHADALTMVFEGSSAGSAQLTTWMYTGGPAVGFTRVVASGGLTIGRTRQDLLARFPHAVDRGDVVDTNGPTDLRFGLRGDLIAWFGDTDCDELADPGQPG